MYILCPLARQTPITPAINAVSWCKVLAQSLGIELLFLPPYSPNLNLIERFWKFVKKQCLYSKYYADHHAFEQAIRTCIAQAPTPPRPHWRAY